MGILDIEVLHSNKSFAAKFGVYSYINLVFSLQAKKIELVQNN